MTPEHFPVIPHQAEAVFTNTVAEAEGESGAAAFYSWE